MTLSPAVHSRSLANHQQRAYSSQSKWQEKGEGETGGVVLRVVTSAMHVREFGGGVSGGALKGEGVADWLLTMAESPDTGDSFPDKWSAPSSAYSPSLRVSRYHGNRRSGA